MRSWPEEWPVSLGFLGQHYSWPRAELEALTLAEIEFWVDCASRWNAKVKEAGTS